MANPKNWLKSRFNRSPERGFGNIEKEYLRSFKQKKEFMHLVKIIEQQQL